MPLSQPQADAVLAALDKSFAATFAKVKASRDADQSGVVHGALELVGLNANDAAEDAVVGDVRMTGAQIQRLRNDAGDAVADPDQGDRWIDAAKDIETALKKYPQYETEATLDDVLAKTAAKTGDDVKHEINNVAKGALSFAWAALPWWVLAGGGVVVVIGGVVMFRQFRAARAVAAAVV